LNKQYVKEQIEAAISEIREEYDKKFENIYQCPDCGAVTFRDSEHICLAGKIQEEVTIPKKKTIADYILSIIMKVPPDIDEIINSDSVYTTQGIISHAISAGCTGTENAIASALSDMVKKKKIVNRRAATIRIMTTSKAGKIFEKEVSGFIYWSGGVP
jgi:dGTP triphosphohydrolase